MERLHEETDLQYTNRVTDALLGSRASLRYLSQNPEYGGVQFGLEMQLLHMEEYDLLRLNKMDGHYTTDDLARYGGRLGELIDIYRQNNIPLWAVTSKEVLCDLLDGCQSPSCRYSTQPYVSTPVSVSDHQPIGAGWNV